MLSEISLWAQEHNHVMGQVWRSFTLRCARKLGWRNSSLEMLCLNWNTLQIPAHYLLKKKSAYTDGFLSAAAVLVSEIQNRKKLILWFLRLCLGGLSPSALTVEFMASLACGNSRMWMRGLLSGNRCGLNKRSGDPVVCFGRILRWARGFITKPISRYFYRS